MVDTTLLNKLGLIYKFLSDNSLIAMVLLLIAVIIMDLLYGRNKKSTKTLYIVIILLAIVYILMCYYKPFINIIDTYIANIFRLTYFPSIIEYFSMILITILIQIISIKKYSGFTKHMNIWVGIFIEVLFIVNVIAMNNITVNLSSLTSIYENDLLLSIFQTTGIIFMIWIILNLLIFLVSLFLSDGIEMPKLNKDYYE